MNKNLLGYLSEYQCPPINRHNPYNEIDALVFAVFSYAPTGADIRGFSEEFQINPVGKTIGQLSRILTDIELCGLLHFRFGRSTMGNFGQHFRFFYYLINNARYKDIEITGFAYDNNNYCQFSAYTFKLAEDEFVIAYRGTDNSLEGWYESYKMYNCDIPGQALALRYLQSQMKKNEGVYRLVGHSKGGRLAMDAAVNCSTKEKMNIRSIINFDGPGFDLDFIKRNYRNILTIQHKTYLFAPVDTFVSTMFFGHEILYYKKNRRHIKPYGIQIAPSQHFYFNWTLNASNRFEIARQSKMSRMFEEKTKEILELSSPVEIEEIIEEIFKKVQQTNKYKAPGTGLSSIEVLGMFLSLTLKLTRGKAEPQPSHDVK